MLVLDPSRKKSELRSSKEHKKQTELRSSKERSSESFQSEELRSKRSSEMNRKKGFPFVKEKLI